MPAAYRKETRGVTARRLSDTIAITKSHENPKDLKGNVSRSASKLNVSGQQPSIRLPVVEYHGRPCWTDGGRRQMAAIQKPRRPPAPRATAWQHSANRSERQGEVLCRSASRSSSHPARSPSVLPVTLFRIRYVRISTPVIALKGGMRRGDAGDTDQAMSPDTIHSRRR